MERELPSDLRISHPLCRKIQRELESAGYTDDETYIVYIAMDEIVTNAVKWGNMRDRKKKVYVRTRTTPRYFYASITDEGTKYFDHEGLIRHLDEATSEEVVACCNPAEGTHKLGLFITYKKLNGNLKFKDIKDSDGRKTGTKASILYKRE